MSAQRAALDAVPCTNTTGKRPGPVRLQRDELRGRLLKQIAEQEASELGRPDRSTLEPVGKVAVGSTSSGTSCPAIVICSGSVGVYISSVPCKWPSAKARRASSMRRTAVTGAR